jgi:hypothetical protein
LLNRREAVCEQFGHLNGSPAPIIEKQMPDSSAARAAEKTDATKGRDRNEVDHQSQIGAEQPFVFGHWSPHSPSSLE